MKNNDIHRSELVLGAISKSPSTVERAFNSIIKDAVTSMIETKRAEVGANVLQKPRQG